MEKDFKKIFVVGAGTMGHGIAQAFAQGGYQVSLFSRTRQTLDRAAALTKTSLDTLAEGGLVDREQIQIILDRIHPTQSLEEGTHEADLAIETVVENKDAKIEIFKQLDTLCPPRTLLASNTTFLNIYDFLETSRPDKILNMHWYTPPQIIPLVDVVKGLQTSDEDIKRVVQLLKKIGKKPVVFNKPATGYVVSRLQMALGREINYLLDNDYLSPEELDDAAKWGLAFRMMVVGVVQRYDFGGLDLSIKFAETPSAQALATPLDYKPKKLYELFNHGHFGVKTGKGFYDYQGKSEAEVCRNRDIRLIKLLKAIQDIDLSSPVM